MLRLQLRGQHRIHTYFLPYQNVYDCFNKSHRLNAQVNHCQLMCEHRLKYSIDPNSLISIRLLILLLPSENDLSLHEL